MDNQEDRLLEVGTPEWTFGGKEKVRLEPTNDPAIFVMLHAKSGVFICYIEAMGEDWNPESEEQS